nr:putative protein TPRXL isoform X2 [Hydra vulgaris]
MIIVIKYLFTLWLSTVLLFSILQSVQGNETSSFEYSTYQSSSSTASFTRSSVQNINSSTTNTSTTTSSYFVKSPSTENLSSTSGISISSSVPETSFTTIFSSFLTTDSSKMFTSSYTFAAPLSSSINIVSVFYTSSSQNIFTSTFYKGYDFVACEQKNNCKNGGSCALNKSNNSTICLCNHNYFGNECQYEEIIPHALPMNTLKNWMNLRSLTNELVLLLSHQF